MSEHRPIRVLSPHVADLIAAGEVVQRPASVVKELLENSIDAGADNITVEISGNDFIRVTDNGKGMPPGECETSFLRHATSKLSGKEDLENISTLGFRGEALAAISSVSRISLLTREKNSPSGISITNEAGRIVDKSETGCPEGTTIIVRDLFFNTPARKKFLKRDSTEAAHILEAVQQTAIANPNISFRLIKDNAEILRTPGSGELLPCLYSIYGRDLALNMQKAEFIREKIKVQGYVGAPSQARSSRKLQIFIVNGRPVRSLTLMTALGDAFKNDIPQGKYPVCALVVTLPHNNVDVNVHPAKTEIKFLNEREVFEAVYFACMSALSTGTHIKEVKLQQPALAPLGFKQTDAVKPEMVEQSVLRNIPKVYNSGDIANGSESMSINDVGNDVGTAFKGNLSENGISAEKTVNWPGESPLTVGVVSDNSPVSNPPVEYEAPFKAENTASYNNSGQNDDRFEKNEEYRYIGQVLGGFLLAGTADALFIIDRHAAHERILFEKLKGGQSIFCQRLIEPLSVSLSPAECDILLLNEKILFNLGFELEEFGGSTVIVRSCPDFVSMSEIGAFLSELAEKLRSGAKNPSMYDDALHLVACKSAVKLGSSDMEEDMKNLVKTVMETPGLRHCPHGRPIAIRLTRSQLLNQFGR